MAGAAGFIIRHTGLGSRTDSQVKLLKLTLMVGVDGWSGHQKHPAAGQAYRVLYILRALIIISLTSPAIGLHYLVATRPGQNYFNHTQKNFSRLWLALGHRIHLGQNNNNLVSPRILNTGYIKTAILDQG